MNWKSSKVFICGTVRNCEPYIESVFENIDKISKLFADYHIIIAYDNSTDLSLLKLTKQKSIHGSKLDIIINNNPLTRRRTENISNARNVYMQRMRDLTPTFSADYFIAMDMDDVCAMNMNIKVLTDTMDESDKWESVSFNRKGYYDLWALSIDKYVYSCWGWYSCYEVVEHMRKYIVDKLSKSTDLVECRSAFNGFAVYKTSHFLGINYDWKMPKEYMDYSELLEQQKILWGTGSISDLSQKTDEPDCEHRAFHMRATALNGARIRISPEFLFLKHI